MTTLLYLGVRNFGTSFYSSSNDATQDVVGSLAEETEMYEM